MYFMMIIRRILEQIITNFKDLIFLRIDLQYSYKIFEKNETFYAVKSINSKFFKYFSPWKKISIYFKFKFYLK